MWIDTILTAAKVFVSLKLHSFNSQMTWLRENPVENKSKNEIMSWYFTYDASVHGVYLVENSKCFLRLNIRYSIKLFILTLIAHKHLDNGFLIK